MSSREPDAVAPAEGRLRAHLLEQGLNHRQRNTHLEPLLDLEARIRATAREIDPAAPQAAIASARREIAYQDLAGKLVRRSELPVEFLAAPEALSIRIQRLENTILDLAHGLETSQPSKAIAHATHIAHRQLRADTHFGATFLLEEAHQQLAAISRRLGRFAAIPRPTRQQRVHRVLMDLRRSDLLELDYRHTSEARHQLAFHGNVTELESELRRVGDPRQLLEQSVAEVYRDPELAVRRMRENTSRRDLQGSIERFAQDPAAFGKLRGVHVPGLGDSPARAKALDRASTGARRASRAQVSRERMELDLESAVSLQRRLTENRELAGSLPSREVLMAELGRHMEGLELHEVRPLLQPGQAKLVQDVRRADQQFLEPLREAARRFRVLHGGDSAQLAAEAKKIAGLYQAAPRHVLRRLSPPRMQAVLAAPAMARRVANVASRVARV